MRSFAGLLLIVASLALRHVGTASYPEVTILDRTVVIEVRADVLLFADYLDFGVKRGGSLSREALLSRAADVGALTARSIRVVLDGADAPLVVDDVAIVPAPTGPGLFRVRLSATAAAPIRTIEIDYGVFREHDPAHRGYARIRHGADEMAYVFARGIPFRWRLDDGGAATLPKSRAWLGFLLDGIEHILAGIDHLLFLLGLVVTAKSAGSVAKTVTAFTLAHSLTLGLGAAGVIHLPRQPIEIAIALSIAWVGFANLWGKGEASRWPVAVFFGLVHGLGFSEALAGAQMPAAEFAMALTMFNCGVEVGQLMVLLLVLPPLAFLKDRAPRVHTWVVRGGSILVLLIGLVWAVWRAIDVTL